MTNFVVQFISILKILDHYRTKIYSDVRVDAVQMIDVHFQNLTGVL